MYVIGKTGTGKSTLLETLALQDIAHGRGMMLIDPHGDLAERVVEAVPAHRRQDVNKIALAASGLMEAFKKMWPDAWGVRMEHVLRKTLLTLLEVRQV
jgi:stage III sporulation protein SpoIIIAA